MLRNSVHVGDVNCENHNTAIEGCRQFLKRTRKKALIKLQVCSIESYFEASNSANSKATSFLTQILYVKLYTTIHCLFYFTTGQPVTLGELGHRTKLEIYSGSRILEGLDPSGRILIHHTLDDSSSTEDVR